MSSLFLVAYNVHIKLQDMKLKRNIVSALLLTVYMSAMAFTGLKVTLTDGSSTIISMEECPIVKFIGDKLLVTTDVSTTEFERSKVKTFNYISPSSIDGINNDGNVVSNTGDSLQFGNLPANSEISVYDVSGKLVKNATADGSYRINISDLSAGVYVVSVNGVSTKITIKR